MRNYVKELTEYGLSLRQIERDTGIRHQRLSEILKGKKPINSSHPYYNTLRNLSRKTGYKLARDLGLTPKESAEVRRTMAKPPTKENTRTEVKKTRVGGNIVQYIVRGLFQHTKSKIFKKSDGGSRGYSPETAPPLEDLFEQALNAARKKLGGTNWRLIKVIYEGWKHHVLIPNA